MLPDVLGSYRILGKLGEGGMGEVYRARDTKLGRDVALKVLPDDVAGDPDLSIGSGSSRAKSRDERLKRFEREARTLAALNHPHIAQVYGFEDSGTVRALVMELVPGESLADRIARHAGAKAPASISDGAPPRPRTGAADSGGAPGLPFDSAQGRQTRGLPVRDALEFARQIADGLEAAHDKGIIHRDLKPANVQVTPEGVAKILDFGLAKAIASAPGAKAPGLQAPGLHDDSEDSPTITAGTRHGVILGTAAYMSPEQARGLPVDARTDIWAFGGVLYEMLTGARAFAGATATDVLVAILEREPDWSALPAATPPAIRTLLQRCLKKDPRQRLHHIADARFVLEDTLASPGSEDPGLHSGAQAVGAAPQPARPVWRHPLSLSLALASLFLGGTLAWSLGRTPALPPKEPTYLSLVLPSGQELTTSVRAISPGGLDVVYGGVSEEGPPGPEGNVAHLYHRRLTESAGRALPGTEGGIAPFFSPDGAWVAFVSLADSKLKKIALAGGGPVVVADLAGLPRGIGQGTWTTTDHLVFGDSNGPVRRVPAGGGVPEVVVPRNALGSGEVGMTFPLALPGDAGTIFHAGSSTAGRIAAFIDGKPRTLLKDAFQPRLSATGHLLFVRRQGSTQVGGSPRIDLSAVALDSIREGTEGTPVAVLSLESRVFSYDVSNTGTLLYSDASPEYRAGRFAWLAQDDRPVPPRVPDPPVVSATIMSPRVSPDGREVLYHVGGQAGQLVVMNLSSRLTRILATGPHSWSAWSHDGRRVIYQEPPDAEGGAGMSWKPADSSAAPERLTHSKSWQQPQAVTRDGRYLIYQESGGLGTRDAAIDENYDLWLLPLNPRGEPRPLLRTKANEKLPYLSPDERWMAYVSDETGRLEIWVRSFLAGTAAVQVSQDGGTEPVWAPDGRTLYYRDSTGMHLSAVPVTFGSVPQFGTPVVTSGSWTAGFPYGRMYDISPDGSALLMLPAATQGRELRVVLNFDEVIRRKMAGAVK